MYIVLAGTIYVELKKICMNPHAYTSTSIVQQAKEENERTIQWYMSVVATVQEPAGGRRRSMSSHAWPTHSQCHPRTPSNFHSTTIQCPVEEDAIELYE